MPKSWLYQSIRSFFYCKSAAYSNLFSANGSEHYHSPSLSIFRMQVSALDPYLAVYTVMFFFKIAEWPEQCFQKNYLLRGIFDSKYMSALPGLKSQNEQSSAGIPRARSLSRVAPWVITANYVSFCICFFNYLKIRFQYLLNLKNTKLVSHKFEFDIKLLRISTLVRNFVGF